MRMFTAVRLSEEAIEDLTDFLEPRREAFAVRWTPPEQWHVTLAFMGEVPDRAVEDLIDRTAAAASRRSAFEIAVVGGGVFPDPFAAKVFWAGLAPSAPAGDELERLAVGCRTAASTAGIAVDGARFRPHVTLARPRRSTEATRWLRLLETYRGPSWRVDDVELVTSVLGAGRNGGAQHDVIASFSLE